MILQKLKLYIWNQWVLCNVYISYLYRKSKFYIWNRYVFCNVYIE